MKDDSKTFDEGMTLANGSFRDNDPTIQTSGKSGRRGSGDRSFFPKEIISGRYRVLRFLAQGGMGEVYEVDDEELGDRIALKTILPQIAENPTALERFRREILLARRVTHPNVCRIFDIGKHENEDSSISFLTMELLQGETLRDRLQRGRLSSAEALPLVEQMVFGLQAAHSKGIVHRDFKPANVFLVPDGDQTRVVITDFGLARPGGNADTDVTGTGEVVGTPAYMAPEQLEGGELGPAVDIYALGLVMYEMLTGARAFDGDTAFQIAVKRLQEIPTAPSTHIPDLEPRWEQCIMRCLERKPGDRFRKVGEITGVLRGETRLRRRRSKLTLRHLGLLLLGILLLTGGFFASRYLPKKSSDHRPAMEAKDSTRKTIAVLGFQNVSGDVSKDWISTAIAEVLTTELSGGSALRTVPGETVSRCLRDLGMEKVQSMGVDTLRTLRSNLGVDLAVLGSFTTVPGGDALRLDVRVQDVQTGDFIISKSETGTVADFLSLADRVSRSLKEELHISGNDEHRMAGLPTNPDAARTYSRGIEMLRTARYQEALQELQKASKLEADSAAVFLALSKVWQDLGFKGKSLSAAEKSLELSKALDKEQRLRAQGRVAMLSGRMEEATQAYSSLWTFYPDNPEYGLAYANAQIAGGQPARAMETVARLRQLPEPASLDPRIDMKEAEALGVRGDFQKQLKVASRAEARAEKLGARQLLADALAIKTGALIRLGELEKAKAAILRAEKIREKVGNRGGVADAIQKRAIIAYHQGDLPEAENLFEQALKIFEKLGARGAIGEVFNGLGGVQLASGNATEAEEYFRKALEVYEETEDRRNQARLWANIAVLKQRAGDFSSAIDALERARVILRKVGARDQEARVLRNIAATYYGRGQLKEARRSFEQVLAIDRETGNRAELAGSLFSLGDVLTESGEWAEALNRYRESGKIAKAIEDQRQVALADFGRVVVTAERAFLEDAPLDGIEKELSVVLQELNGAGAEDFGVLAEVLAARIAEGLGDLQGARQHMKAAAERLGGVSDLGTQTAVRLQNARLEFLEGRGTEALGQLKKLLSEVEKTGVLGLEYQIRLGLGEVEMGLPDQKKTGRHRLEILRQETDTRGWRLLAMKIDKLLKSEPS